LPTVCSCTPSCAATSLLCWASPRRKVRSSHSDPTKTAESCAAEHDLRESGALHRSAPQHPPHVQPSNHLLKISSDNDTNYSSR
jgi:hypothetical protein